MARLLAGCGEVEEPIPTHALYGTLTSTSVDASRKPAWVKIVEATGSANDAALFEVTCTMNGPSCDYTIWRIPEGEYSVYALVDLNQNKSSVLWADSGDLVAGPGAVFLLENTRMDFADGAWRPVP